MDLGNRATATIAPNTMVFIATREMAVSLPSVSSTEDIRVHSVWYEVVGQDNDLRERFILYGRWRHVFRCLIIQTFPLPIP